MGDRTRKRGKALKGQVTEPIFSTVYRTACSGALFRPASRLGRNSPIGGNVLIERLWTGASHAKGAQSTVKKLAAAYTSDQKTNKPLRGPEIAGQNRLTATLVSHNRVFQIWANLTKLDESGNGKKMMKMANPQSKQTETVTLRYAIGGDHAGFELKQLVCELLTSQEVPFFDCGTDSADSCDFPDFAELVAEKIRNGEVDRGILVCGSGVGVSVAANKFPGIRASLCHDSYSARQGVEHDDMNVLCIGARVIGPELAFECVRSFLNARYSPQDRHARRLAKIVAIEQRFLGGQG